MEPLALPKKLLSAQTVINGLVLALLLSLAGCVTTERGGIGSKADEAKALEYSVQLARSYIRQQNWDAAKRHLKNALDIDDSSADVYEALALVFQNTGEIELAENNFRQAIKIAPEFPRARNNFAAFLYQHGRYKEAVQQLEVVVADTLYEQRASAYVNLGLSYLQLGELKSAEKAFYRAYLMDRRSVSLKYQLADVYFQLGDFAKSQQFYDGYRSQVKKQPAKALWLGIRLAKEFDNQNAASSYALALKNLYPSSREYLEYKKAFNHGR